MIACNSVSSGEKEERTRQIAEPQKPPPPGCLQVRLRTDDGQPKLNQRNFHYFTIKCDLNWHNNSAGIIWYPRQIQLFIKMNLEVSKRNDLDCFQVCHKRNYVNPTICINQPNGPHADNRTFFEVEMMLENLGKLEQNILSHLIQSSIRKFCNVIEGNFTKDPISKWKLKSLRPLRETVTHLVQLRLSLIRDLVTI